MTQPGSDTRLDGLSILILEDEFLVAITIEDDLQSAGAKETLLARTIAEAREIARLRPDCAVLDLRVPDGLSLDLAQELIATGTSVVFHSGHAEIEELARFRGAIVCSKPSLPEELIDAVLASRRHLEAFSGASIVGASSGPSTPHLRRGSLR